MTIEGMNWKNFKRYFCITVLVAVSSYALTNMFGVHRSLSFILSIMAAVPVIAAFAAFKLEDFQDRVLESTGMSLKEWVLPYMVLFAGMLVSHFHGRPQIFGKPFAYRRPITLYGWILLVYIVSVISTSFYYYNRDKAKYNWKVLVSAGLTVTVVSFLLMLLVG